MEKGDKKRFRDVIQMLGMNYRTQITAPLLQLYWQGLEDLPLAKVEDAVSRAIKECEYMPVVAKLRELSKRSPQKALQPISDTEMDRQKRLVAESWKGKGEEVRQMLAALPDGEFAKAVRGMVTK
jgi:hypothetical protein